MLPIAALATFMLISTSILVNRRRTHHDSVCNNSSVREYSFNYSSNQCNQSSGSDPTSIEICCDGSKENDIDGVNVVCSVSDDIYNLSKVDGSYDMLTCGSSCAYSNITNSYSEIACPAEKEKYCDDSYNRKYMYNYSNESCLENDNNHISSIEICCDGDIQNKFGDWEFTCSQNGDNYNISANNSYGGQLEQELTCNNSCSFSKLFDTHAKIECENTTDEQEETHNNASDDSCDDTYSRKYKYNYSDTSCSDDTHISSVSICCDGYTGNTFEGTEEFTCSQSGNVYNLSREKSGVTTITCDSSCEYSQIFATYFELECPSQTGSETNQGQNTNSGSGWGDTNSITTEAPNSGGTFPTTTNAPNSGGTFPTTTNAPKSGPGPGGDKSPPPNTFSTTTQAPNSGGTFPTTTEAPSSGGMFRTTTEAPSSGIMNVPENNGTDEASRTTTTSAPFDMSFFLAEGGMDGASSLAAMLALLTTVALATHME